MAPRLLTATHNDNDAIRERALRAIAAARLPGLHFPGHFLDIQWRDVAGGVARGTLEEGPHCLNADGTVSLMALGLMADFVLAASARSGVPPGSRLGTVHLHVDFTGAPAVGNIEAEALLLGDREGSRLQTSLSSGTLSAQGKPIAHVHGEYVLLDPPPGVTLGPLPWERTETPAVVPADVASLEPREAAILETCEAALAAASPRVSFIERLWGGAPRRNGRGAANRVPIGPHIGNRVGHVQGGFLLGFAAATARAAAPAAMMLSGVSVWYISPGQGERLSIRSRILHAGRTLVVVGTRILADGKRVVEAISHHEARG